MARERCLVAGAVGNDLELLVEQAALMNRLERPPHRLDIGGVERPVGVLEVDPEADAFREAVPIRDVAQDLLTAASVELGDTEPLDVLFGRETELLLEGELHGQPVTVPTSLSFHVEPAHGLVAGKDVLEHPAEDVVCGRRPVGGGWALVKAPVRAAAAPLQRSREHAPLPPTVEHRSLERRKRRLRFDLAVVRRHGREILGGGSCDDPLRRCACGSITTPTARGSPIARPAPDPRWYCCTRLGSPTGNGSRWSQSCPPAFAWCSP